MGLEGSWGVGVVDVRGGRSAAHERAARHREEKRPRRGSVDCDSDHPRGEHAKGASDEYGHCENEVGGAIVEQRRDAVPLEEAEDGAAGLGEALAIDRHVTEGVPGEGGRLRVGDGLGLRGRA